MSKNICRKTEKFNFIVGIKIYPKGQIPPSYKERKLRYK